MLCAVLACSAACWKSSFSVLPQATKSQSTPTSLQLSLFFIFNTSFDTYRRSEILNSLLVDVVDAYPNQTSHVHLFNIIITPIERKICRFLKLMNSVLKPSCLIWFVIDSESEDFLSHPLPPYDGGRLRRELSRTFGMGVDIVDIPPHLNPPPPRGEEVIFFDSIGV